MNRLILRSSSALRHASAFLAALACVGPLVAHAQATPSGYEFRRTVKALTVSGSPTTPTNPTNPSDPAPNPVPALSLSTQAIDFGNVATNTTEKRQVLVSNPGTGTLSITSEPSVTGAAFAAGLTTCGSTLAAGADCLLEPTFSPTSTGTFNGVLRFTTALAGSPHDITLVGTAFNPVSLASATLPAAKVGQPYSYDFKTLLAVSNEASPDKSLATWAHSGTLPTGLSLNSATGLLSGTPTVKTDATSYTVTGTYKNNQGQQVFVIQVGTNLLEVTMIAGWSNHTCAVTTAGSAKCWGNNEFGKLGNGSTVSSVSPVTPTGLDQDVASIHPGTNHTCARKTNGQVYCWGDNTYQQLGSATPAASSVPVLVTPLGVATQLSSSASHSCIVTDRGSVQCWGSNLYGESGANPATTPTKTGPVSPMSSGASQVSASSYHTCVVTTLGATRCWGQNTYGKLGNGSTTDSYLPVNVTGLSANTKMVSAGSNHTCAVTTTGGAKCWGSNVNGRLGINSSTAGSSTVAQNAADVYGMTTGVSTISAGSNFTCAATTTGSAKCWGSNANGQLGNAGAGSQAIAPVQVTGLSSGVSDVAAAFVHACAVMNDNTASCWGRGDSGELGDGATLSRTAPVEVLN